MKTHCARCWKPLPAPPKKHIRWFIQRTDTAGVRPVIVDVAFKIEGQLPSRRLKLCLTCSGEVILAAAANLHAKIMQIDGHPHVHPPKPG